MDRILNMNSMGLYYNTSDTTSPFTMPSFNESLKFSRMSNLFMGTLNSNDTEFDLSKMADILWNFQQSKREKGSFEIFVDRLNVYFIPVIIICGLCGNTLSAMVFMCTYLRRLSSSLYLVWLSLADLGFLFALGIAWLDRIGVNWLTSSGCCQLVVYLTRVMGCLSVWFVFSFTMERYVIVHHALRKDMLCTRHKAKLVIGTLCALSMLMYTHIFVTYDVISLGSKKICGPLPIYQNFMTVMSSIDAALASIIPSVCILFLNIKIIHKLHTFQNQHFVRKDTVSSSVKSVKVTTRRQSIVQASITNTGTMRVQFCQPEKQQQQQQQQESKTEEEKKKSEAETEQINIDTIADNGNRIVRSRSQLRTARMLLIVSSVFVLLNLPSNVFRVQGFIRHLLWDNIKTPRIQYKVHEFFEIFFYLNFAINFFVYSMCGKQFRTGLKRLCEQIKYRLWKYCRDLVHKMHQPRAMPPQLHELHLQEPLNPNNHNNPLKV